jgi:hypothetical protein
MLSRIDLPRWNAAGLLGVSLYIYAVIPNQSRHSRLREGSAFAFALVAWVVSSDPGVFEARASEPELVDGLAETRTLKTAGYGTQRLYA